MNRAQSYATVTLVSALTIIGAFFVNFSEAHATSIYYLSTEGSDANNGSADAPWATFTGAFGRMSGGDALIVKDGVYYESLKNIPSGSALAYTVVKAENDGNVIIDGSRIGEWASALDIRDTSYARVEGFKFKSGKADGTGTGTALILGSHHIKILRDGFYDTGTRSPDSTGNISLFVIEQSQHILVEDSWAWGYGRYKFEAHESSEIIFRRVVARHDRMDSQYPQALFSIYRSKNTELQNVIAIDSDQSSYYTGYAGFYGAIYSPNNDAAYHNSGTKILGSIVLNVDGLGVNIPITFGNHTIRDTVIWRAQGGISYETPSGASVNIEHSTVGDIYGANVGDIFPQSGIGAYGFTAGSRIVNSTLYRNNVRALNGFGFSDYNNFYDNGQNYGGSWNQEPTPQGAHDRFVNPSINYITRVEFNSPLKGAGNDGGDIGANVLTRYGRSGTLWGETGYEELTNESLWPWPNEERIKSDFRTYNSGPSGSRGFAADGMTLTKYIWEYLGNSCPTDICGVIASSPAPVPAPTSTPTPTPTSSLPTSTSTPTSTLSAPTSTPTPSSTSISTTTPAPASAPASASSLASVPSPSPLPSTAPAPSPLSTSMPTPTIFTPAPAAANVYYVSIAGNDSGPGTLSEPWRTLQNAADQLQPGQKVLVGDGEYEGFYSIRSGTFTNPILFKANGNNVIVDSPNRMTPDGINIANHSHIIIDGFKVRNQPRHGIRAVGASGVMVKNTMVSDNAAAGLSLVSTVNSVVQNNLIHGNGTGGSATAGIHLAGNGAGKHSNNNVAVNNTMVEPRMAGVKIGKGSTGNVLFNNILISARPWVVAGRGNYIDAASNLQRFSARGIFVNFGAGNFRLSPRSPAVNIGKSAYRKKSAPRDDLEGSVRPKFKYWDAGAYENK